MKPLDLKSRLERAGRSQVALARHLNISKDSAYRLVNAQRDPTVNEAAEIEAFFSDGLEDVGPRMIEVPVFGYAAAGGDDRIALASNLVLDTINVPAGLGAGELMAIRVAGDSMSPRLFPGEIVIVGRNLPPQRNGDCVVEFMDGTAIVKQYRGQREGYIFLFQYNPETEVRISATKVRAVHAVIYRR
jgi:phage repressor protein C with HTH and peptisase S24 domain